MKEYFVTFCISFFMTIIACFFNYFQSTFIGALGGLPLAAVAYLRISAVNKASQNVYRHAAVFYLGTLVLYLPILATMFSDTVGSLMTVVSWLLAVTFSFLCYKMRKKLLAYVSAFIIVWLAFVILVLPAWDRYIFG